jgi:DNA-binding transcriptional regulator/RsmH inhibitor MraZ
MSDLIIDKELFEELKTMMSSSNENDIVVAIGILNTIDIWDKQNQKYKEELYEILNENKNIKNKGELKTRIWMSQFE